MAQAKRLLPGLMPEVFSLGLVSVSGERRNGKNMNLLCLEGYIHPFPSLKSKWKFPVSFPFLHPLLAASKSACPRK